jgi:hypothetical protein
MAGSESTFSSKARRLLGIIDVPVDPGDEDLPLVVVAEQTTDHLAHLGLWPLSLSLKYRTAASHSVTTHSNKLLQLNGL